MSDQFDSKDLDELAARQNANRHLALYLKTRDERLIWKAYQEFRNLDLEVPEELLKKLDEFAEASVQTGRSGQDNQRDIIEYMYSLNKSNLTPKEINKMTADKFSTTVSNVKKVYSTWMKESKKEKEQRLMDDFLSKPAVTRSDEVE